MSDEERPAVRRFKDTTIRPVKNKEIDSFKERVYLLMGPIGSGKSSFIEALAGNDDLKISKDQLDSYTQTMTAYKLVDYSLLDGSDLPPDGPRTNIIDTPGFSDSKVSEFEIIQMVNNWLKTHKCENIHTIFYLCPITDTRLSGSKRRTIEMLKLLTGINTQTKGSVVVVTTMWDRLWNERGKIAAEGRFTQLRDDIWADLRDSHQVVTKFWNTHESALDIVNATMDWKDDQNQLYEDGQPSAYDAYDLKHCGPPEQAPFGPHLYQDLLDRIQSVQQLTLSAETQLAGPDARSNSELKRLLKQQLRRDRALLEKFERQLIDFGQPPEGFERVTPLLQAIKAKNYDVERTPLSALKSAFRGLMTVKNKMKRRK
ncbi:hypothetical protein BJ165DRAFT_1486773 [Panaeolus papilionaceus]|nr:hypothetical protein BJ165DRAFT_1486773 [Panaeolus papilionaceus]